MNKQAKIILFSCLYIFGILASFTNIWFGIFALTTICLLQLIKKFFSAKYFVSIIFILIAGFTNTYLNTNYDDDLTPYTENNVILNAKVISIPSNSIENRTKFFASANSLEFEDEVFNNLNAKTLITINDSQEKIQKIEKIMALILSKCFKVWRVFAKDQVCISVQQTQPVYII